MAGEYRDTILLLARGCDFSGRWKPSNIFITMQELAGAHADQLGCGYADLSARSLAFVLTRTELRMTRYPHIGERVVCRTWAGTPVKWLFPRYFLFEDEAGGLLGTASTLWVVMDLNTRRMTPPQRLGVTWDAPELPMAMELAGRALPVEQETAVREYLPGYEEIDVNGHVNNTRYVAWICDELGVDTLGEQPVDTLCVNYAHEILPGERVTLRVQRENDDFRMSGEAGGIARFALSGTLKRKQAN